MTQRICPEEVQSELVLRLESSPLDSKNVFVHLQEFTDECVHNNSLKAAEREMMTLPELFQRF